MPTIIDQTIILYIHTVQEQEVLPRLVFMNKCLLTDVVGALSPLHRQSPKSPPSDITTTTNLYKLTNNGHVSTQGHDLCLQFCLCLDLDHTACISNHTLFLIIIHFTPTYLPSSQTFLASFCHCWVKYLTTT